MLPDLAFLNESAILVQAGYDSQAALVRMRGSGKERLCGRKRMQRRSYLIEYKLDYQTLAAQQTAWMWMDLSAEKLATGLHSDREF